MKTEKIFLDLRPCKLSVSHDGAYGGRHYILADVADGASGGVLELVLSDDGATALAKAIVQSFGGLKEFRFL